MENDSNKIVDNNRISVVDNSVHSSGDVISLSGDKKISELESRIKVLSKNLRDQSENLIIERAENRSLNKSIFDKNIFVNSFEILTLRFIKLFEQFISKFYDNDSFYTSVVQSKYMQYRFEAIKSSLELRNIPISVFEDICIIGYRDIEGFVVRFEENSAMIIVIIDPSVRSRSEYETWINDFENKIIDIMIEHSVNNLDYSTALSKIDKYKVSDDKFEFLLSRGDIINGRC